MTDLYKQIHHLWIIGPMAGWGLRRWLVTVLSGCETMGFCSSVATLVKRLLSLYSWRHWGTEFVVPFSSCSHSLALKTSIFFLIENVFIWVKTLRYFTQMMIFSFDTSFWMKKGVIWWLFIDDLRAREREEKGTTTSAPGSSVYTWHECRGNDCKKEISTFNTIPSNSDQSNLWSKNTTGYVENVNGCFSEAHIPFCPIWFFSDNFTWGSI